MSLSLLRHDSAGSTVARHAVTDPELAAGARVAYDATRHRFYFLSMREYRIVETDTTGIPLRVFEADPEWYLEPESRGAGTSPLPRTTPIAVAYIDGYLWTLFSLRVPGASFGGFDTVADFESRHTFVLNVIDVERGVIVGSSQFDEAPFHVVVSGGEEVVHLDENSLTGVIVPEILRPSLNRGYQDD